MRKKVNKKNINKKMTFSEVLQKNPDSAKVFFNHGMACIGCPMAMQETIEQGAKAHGIDVEKLVEELNKKTDKKKKKYIGGDKNV